MRLLRGLLSAALVLAGPGCTERVPAKKPPAPPRVPSLNVSSLGTPSALIQAPVQPPGPTDKLPFDLPLNKGYAIDGSWRGPNQVKGTYQFERIGDFSVTRADKSDVDPKEIREVLEAWITSSGVQRTQSSGKGSYEVSIGYGTAQTLGTITYGIRPETPAKEVTFHLEVREAPRQASR